MEKKCVKCGIVWPFIFFYNHKGYSDGLFAKCKSCCKKDVISNRKKNASYYAEYEKNRCRDPKRSKYISVRTKEHRNKYPEKYKARTAVSNAIRDKKLFKKPCCVCGEIKVQAHHEDYSKPLEVIWVCIKHHRDIE